MTGQPAISLPLHWTPAGLPVGVQLVAAYGREDVLIRVASQLEQARRGLADARTYIRTTGRFLTRRHGPGPDQVIQVPPRIRVRPGSSLTSRHAWIRSGRSTRNCIRPPDSRGSQSAWAAYRRARSAGTSSRR